MKIGERYELGAEAIKFETDYYQKKRTEHNRAAIMKHREKIKAAKALLKETQTNGKGAN